MLWSISWNNVWRNKVRSLIVIFAMIIGLFGGLFGSALMKGMVDQRIKLAIANEVSNIQVHHSEFLLNKELNDTIRNSSQVFSTLDSMTQIIAYSKRLKITGMAASAVIGAGVMINGIEPEREKQVTDIYRYIPDSMGKWFANERRYQVVIGKKLAEKLKLRLRSKLVITFQDNRGNMANSAFKISGIYNTSNSLFDERNIYVSYYELNQLLGFDGQRVHEIAIALKDDSKNEYVLSHLSRAFPALSFQSWKEIMPDLGILDDMLTMWLYIMLMIILLALCFGIINTMMMSVMERTREIGMLMAIGMTRTRIFFMIVLESVFLSLTGGVLGMGVSALIIGLVSRHGIDLSEVSRGLEGIGYSAITYPSLGWDFYLGLTILVIITGMASALMPARRALKLNPVEAIRIV